MVAQFIVHTLLTMENWGNTIYSTCIIITNIFIWSGKFSLFYIGENCKTMPTGNIFYEKKGKKEQKNSQNYRIIKHLNLRDINHCSFWALSLAWTLCTCSDCFFSSSFSFSNKVVHLSFSFFFLLCGYKINQVVNRKSTV